MKIVLNKRCIVECSMSKPYDIEDQLVTILFLCCAPQGVFGDLFYWEELVGSYMFFLKIFSVCDPSLYVGFGYFS